MTCNTIKLQYNIIYVSHILPEIFTRVDKLYGRINNGNFLNILSLIAFDFEKNSVDFC